MYPFGGPSRVPNEEPIGDLSGGNGRELNVWPQSRYLLLPEPGLTGVNALPGLVSNDGFGSQAGNGSFGARPWENAFAEYGGPTSAVRLRQVCELIQALRPGSL